MPNIEPGRVYDGTFTNDAPSDSGQQYANRPIFLAECGCLITEDRRLVKVVCQQHQFATASHVRVSDATGWRENVTDIDVLPIPPGSARNLHIYGSRGK